MAVNTQVSDDLSTYIVQAAKRIMLRKKHLGLLTAGISDDLFVSETDTFAIEAISRTGKFIEASDTICRLWNSKHSQHDRNEEEKCYGQVRVFEDHCIDGRIPRAFEGEADSLKSEKAQMVLARIPSTRQLIPKNTDICANLNNTKRTPLLLFMAHYDSHDSQHGCAAIKLALADIKGASEEVWAHLTPEEIEFVCEARSRSYDEANIALLDLTNLVATNNYHNNARAEDGLDPIQVGVSLLFDTRSMGLELRAPIIKTDEHGTRTLDSTDRPRLKTTELTNDLKGILVNDSHGLPAFGAYKETFNSLDHFEKFFDDVTKLAKLLCEEDDSFNPEARVSVIDFITTYYPMLITEQQHALRFRLLRQVAHQYLTGLSKIQEHHAFSEHAERYISISQDKRFVGKYEVEGQNFIIFIPDGSIGEKRVDIGATVMDATNIDNGKTHILFISTSVAKEVFDKRETNEYNPRYMDALNANVRFFREIINLPKLSNRIDQGNLLPVGVLLDAQTGEVLKIVRQNCRFL